MSSSVSSRTTSGYLARTLILRGAVFLIASAAASVSQACLWTYGTDHHGHRTEVGEPPVDAYMSRLTNREKDRAHWESERDRLKMKSETKAGHEVQNDYAVVLIHLSELDKALEILKQIEREHPGLYGTAANLGTLYELRGENDLALRWIREGIRRNKESHYRTEWLHVRILEAKIALSKDPSWLKTHTVLGLEFGTERIPNRPTKQALGNDGSELSLDDVKQALDYQLEERLQFVGPPDPIVGDLLADLGNVNALEVAVEYAIPVYDLALQYGVLRPDHVRLRKAHFENLVAANPDSGETSSPAIELMQLLRFILGSIAIVVVTLCSWLWWRRSRRAAESEVAGFPVSR